ncbi:HAMP domain-containing sensor histidine kinase [Clostridium sp. KNHs214]|uniref:sensor histidine kinase n=1 Tax=Clostridium sp. KNHs214 TaxID=1540257 RepID=UPI000558BE23|nr:HAMP domain-containing sensor histidine kinase [Clostridium sp. KNHs214]
MSGFYRNYEVKKITTILIILNVIFCVGIYFYTVNIVKDFSRKIVNQNAEVVGVVLQKHPDLEEDLIKCYTRGVSKDTYIKGEKLLESYGYSIKAPLENMPVIKDMRSIFPKINLSIIVLLFIFTIIVIMIEYKCMFKKISIISKSAEKVVEGDFTAKIIEGKEGEFNILAHQFNLMSERLENSIENLKKEKGFLKEIISDISHQLKTPLSSLMLFNELFIEGSIKNEEEKNKFYIKSKSQLERMEWLIKNLLKIAKIEANAVEFERIYNPVLTTVNKALEPLKIKWEAKNQKINIDIKEDIKLKHDVNWTAESITNIVKNCIEHTGEDGEINIVSSETPIYTSIVISDNGPGIVKEDLPHIFKRFYKGRRNKNSDSVGIGLALSKSIIEGQGGSIEVRSVEGEGTEFTIIFLKGII